MRTRSAERTDLLPLLTVALHHEHDVVTARQRARQVARLVGFEVQDQVRIATATSEIARNAFRYAHGGRVEFSVEGQVSPQLLTITVSDDGPGIAGLDDVLAGRYRSRTGMGLGLVGSRRLMDRFAVRSSATLGTVVTMGKLLPSKAPFLTGTSVAALASALAAERPLSPVEEVQQQNRELLRALDELRHRQDELERLNGELEDTNRGVVALYAELDEKADHLQRADQMKSRFLSNMSHEFRTPLNAILALTRLLLDRRDGALTEDQEVQVSLVRKAAQDLSQIVDDLLDLAKVEAGKIEVRASEFEVANLFGALRGMLRPLLVGESVALVFEEPAGVPLLFTDEAKVSQILRNFISNALKFTERGEVRVRAAYDEATGVVAFSVTDTGIGIDPADQERIFQEFTQVDHPVQRRVRGTGLGLPLSRKLATLLGGRLTVTSEVGVGSRFTAEIPAVCPSQPASVAIELPTAQADRVPVLVVEDAPESIVVYKAALADSPFLPVFARSVREARQALRQLGTAPAAIVLDIVLQDEDAWQFLAELRRSDATAHVPIVIASTIDDQEKGLALGADAYAVKPVDGEWLLATLSRLAAPPGRRVALVVDDDRAARYVLRRQLEEQGWYVVEAPDGDSGLRRAAACRPDAIVLDLVMPDVGGLDVLAALRADPLMRHVPVVVATSKSLDHHERDALARASVPLLRKDVLSREDAGAHLTSALREAGVGDAPTMP